MNIKKRKKKEKVNPNNNNKKGVKRNLKQYLKPLNDEVIVSSPNLFPEKDYSEQKEIPKKKIRKKKVGLLDNMVKFYKSGRFSDFSIKFKNSNKTIMVHRLVLASTSDFFNNWFKKNSEQTNNGSFEIEDDEVEFEKILQFMYGEESEEFQNTSNSEIIKYLVLAKKYQVKELEELIINNLKYIEDSELLHIVLDFFEKRNDMELEVSETCELLKRLNLDLWEEKTPKRKNRKIEVGLLDNMFKFYKNERLTDFSIKFKYSNRKIMVHKLVLACASGFFDNLFKKGSKQKNNDSFEIEDNEVNFEKVLMFMYGRELEESRNTSNSEIIKYLVLAKKYKIEKLIKVILKNLRCTEKNELLNIVLEFFEKKDNVKSEISTICKLLRELIE